MKMKKIILYIWSFVCVCPLFAQSGPVFSGTVFEKGDNGVHTYRIPSMVQTNAGTILAFAEARKNSSKDTGDIDLVLRRSSDGGRTWGEIITVWDDAENVCGNPTPVVDRTTGRILLFSTWNNGLDVEKDIRIRASIDTRRVFVLYSDDDGLTWTDAREITSDVKLPEWTWYATGPCHAIQLTKGKYKGRIVVPCNHDIFGERTHSHVFYTDDAGESFHLGGCLEVGNESTVAELKNGDLLLNMRGSKTKTRVEKGAARFAAVSHDGGKTFEDPYNEYGLIEPVCNASIINYYRNGRTTSTLLFSNPEHKTKRKNMSVRQSDDSGRTWRTVCRLSDCPAAYSDLLVLDNRDVAILYETGDDSCYEKIVFSVLPRKIFNKN